MASSGSGLGAELQLPVPQVIAAPLVPLPEPQAGRLRVWLLQNGLPHRPGISGSIT